jgi:hypothetical protein
MRSRSSGEAGPAYFCARRPLWSAALATKYQFAALHLPPDEAAAGREVFIKGIAGAAVDEVGVDGLERQGQAVGHGHLRRPLYTD